MRFARTGALAAVAVLTLAAGPLVLLLAGATLLSPRVRAWLRPTWRVVAAWVAAVLALVAAAIVLPDGRLPILPGPGALATPSYVGRPALTEPLRVTPPAVAPAAAVDLAGPLGESPRVRTRSYGLDDCRRIAVDSHGRLVTLCGDAGAPLLRLVDPESLRQLAVKELAGRHGGCPAAFHLDADQDRVVVAAGARRLLVVGTADGEGDPDLTTEVSLSLEKVLTEDDCVVGLAPDAAGRTWLVSRTGRVVVVEAGKARMVDLAEPVSRTLVVGAGGAYVVTDEAAYRITAAPGSRPVVAWRSPVGEPAGAPAVLAGDLVAVTDGSDVVLLHAADGRESCRSEVYAGALVATGAGVVVQNAAGYRGPLSTVLGRAAAGGLALVLPPTEPGASCRVAWESDQHAPSGSPAVSAATGLLYAYTKRPSRLGVDAWYLSALDARTGRTRWSVRTGLGVLRDNHHGSVALGPDGSVYVPVLGGLVRVHDRE